MPPYSYSAPSTSSPAPVAAKALPALKLAFNADLAAIVLALALAALVRFNVLPRIGW